MKREKTGSASDIRYSTSLSEETYYYAVLTEDGAVIRLANTLSSIRGSFLEILPVLCLIAALIFIITLVIASKMTKRIVSPINEIDLHNPLGNHLYEEFSPMLIRLNSQKEEIAAHLSLLNQKQDEFYTITESMSEGLIILDNFANVVFVNASAVKMLNGLPDVDYKNKNLVFLNRDPSVTDIVNKALAGDNKSVILTFKNSYFQFFASPVYTDGYISGCVILILDVSEKYAAEQSRKEFTANVSHELKTPLTSVSGYAELLSLGTVDKKDIPVFCEKNSR